MLFEFQLKMTLFKLRLNVVFVSFYTNSFIIFLMIDKVVIKITLKTRNNIIFGWNEGYRGKRYTDFVIPVLYR